MAADSHCNLRKTRHRRQGHCGMLKKRLSRKWNSNPTMLHLIEYNRNLYIPPFAPSFCQYQCVIACLMLQLRVQISHLTVHLYFPVTWICIKHFLQPLQSHWQAFLIFRVIGNYKLKAVFAIHMYSAYQIYELAVNGKKHEWEERHA